MTLAKPHKLEVLYDASGLQSRNPDDLRLLLSIPDKDWDNIVRDPSKLIVIMGDALLAAIRGVAEIDDHLSIWIQETADAIKMRAAKSDNNLAMIVPASTVDTTNETKH